MIDAPVIFLTAAEASGDQHAANLTRALRRRVPQARIVAFAGPRVRDAGAELLADLTSRSAMLLGSLGRVPEMIAHYIRFDQFLDRQPVALHIPVDSPAANLPLAGRSRQHAVPVLYYIAPQLWAWGDWRVNRVRQRVSRIACILPFEPDWFAQRDVPATFVGHPMFEPLVDFRADPAFVATLPAGQPRIALLPGSRGHELRDHLPAQLRLAEKLCRSNPNASFVVAAPPPQHGHSLDIAAMVRRTHAPVTLVTGRLHDVLTWADMAVAVSGSVTLEVAWFGVPMVVMYYVKLWQWHWVGKRLLKTPFLSLPNIVASRHVVPELMPWFGDDKSLIHAVESLLNDEPRRLAMSAELKAITAPLAATRASDRVAELAEGYLSNARHG